MHLEAVLSLVIALSFICLTLIAREAKPFSNTLQAQRMIYPNSKEITNDFFLPLCKRAQGMFYLFAAVCKWAIVAIPLDS